MKAALHRRCCKVHARSTRAALDLNPSLQKPRALSVWAALGALQTRGAFPGRSEDGDLVARMAAGAGRKGTRSSPWEAITLG